MADNEDLTNGARFAASVPQRQEPFPLKGCGALDWGMQSRLARVFRPDTRRTVMLAIDHGYFQGPTTGLERVDLSILPLLPHADALMTTGGMVPSTVPPASRVPVVLLASGGRSSLRELSDERVAVGMEDAARINAAAVAVQVFVGGEFETQSVRNMTRLVDAGQRYGIPVLAVTAVGQELTRDARYLRLATRICAELGAHFVKTYYCEPDFDTVAAACPVPLVMAGGRKLPERDALTMAYHAIENGAAGVDMGRNILQSVTAIAPAIAGMFTMPFIVLNAGVAAPMAFLGAFVIALLVGYVLAQFARHLSSTGSYYTFVSRSLGGRAGFLVAWVYLLCYPVVIAQVGSFMGSTLQSTLKAEYNITFEWWWFMVFLILFVAYTAWRGIELSVKLLIALGLIEGAIVLVLGLWGLASPGPGGTNLNWVTQGFHGSALHGLFLGVVFAIFAITGWDGAAPLAEESRDPKRTVPRAVMGSILIMGVFLIVVSWGQTSGWGINNLDSFASSSQL